MADGLLMFAKYAFPPNYLQLCGPSENKELFDILTSGNAGVLNKDLKHLLSQFSGAVPYLKLIAQSNGIKDEFDKRVVEAYWLGNSLLKNVAMRDVFNNIERRFKKNMKIKDWFWLIGESIPEAKPFHGFHVFDIYRRAGLLRSGGREKIIETMDKCRISWGRIENIELGRRGGEFFSGSALVKCAPLVFRQGKLAVGNGIERNFFVLDQKFKKGDEVCLHWDYICDKITLLQKKNLIYWTDYHLKIANRTI